MLVDSKVIELSGMELQKLRINLQKMQQQNFQLAQANSQMLAVPSHLLITSYTILLNHAVQMSSGSNGISSSH
jgi:translation initiation factor RLI1